MRILILSDLSGLGKCSLAADIAILSAFSHEAVAIPTAVLSTQTGGFSGYACTVLTAHAVASLSHYMELEERFDAIFTGYLPDPALVHFLLSHKAELLTSDGILLTDPIMADNGAYYDGFGARQRDALFALSKQSDVIFPNETEALYLSNAPDWRSAANILSLATPTVIITGIRENDGVFTAVTHQKETERLPVRPVSPHLFHGAGDVFAATFTGAYLSTKDCLRSVKLADTFTHACLLSTVKEAKDTRYGTAFPSALSLLQTLIVAL